MRTMRKQKDNTMWLKNALLTSGISLFTVLFLAFMELEVYAETSGLEYTYSTSTDGTYEATVTGITDNICSDGILEIPDSVVYNDEVYKVTTIIAYAFYECTDLQSVTLGKNVSSIGNSAFRGCTSLETVTMENNVTSIANNAFMQCESLKSITLSNQLTCLSNQLFSGCTELKSITIPAAVVDIQSYAFEKCESLTTVTIEGNNVSLGNGLFSKCTQLETVYVEGSISSIGRNILQNCSQIVNFVIDSEKEAALMNLLYYANITNATVNGKAIVLTEELTEDTTANTTTSATQAWSPSTIDEIYNFSLKGSTAPIYQATSTSYTIRMENQVQGQLCINVFRNMAGGYTLGRTYNILTNEQYQYCMEESVLITLTIPEELQQENRLFRMICVTENGQATVLEDLDLDAHTITFATNQFYAFALCYLDE